VTEKELARGGPRRLAVIRHAQEVTGNVSMTCRYFGITRQAFYKWLRRYEEQGLEGLRDRSRGPHVIPHATKPEVVSKIVYLRQHYHFGPHKIAMYLKRYHDIEVSPSGVWRILKRLDMSRLPASQRYRRHVDRWKRYEKPLPGHRVQIDVKFIAPLPGSRKKKHYQPGHEREGSLAVHIPGLQAEAVSGRRLLVSLRDHVRGELRVAPHHRVRGEPEELPK